MKIAVNGAAGAMGRRVIALIALADDLALDSALERADHPDLGKDAGIVAGIEEQGVPLTAELQGKPDVLVDFSTPEATMRRVSDCAERGVPVVIGTTGLSAEHRQKIETEAAAQVAILIAANMSVGINLLLRLVDWAARTLPAGYDVEITEAHHRRKRDAPSGTALELARVICVALNRDAGVLRHGREGRVGPRPSEEVGVHAIRAGDIVGEHTVLFAGEGERLELTHRASSRDVFARGALQAARFLVEKPPGLYSMQDALP
ncbi:MAG: 4-hydroxy-tetrahydrodipicolinate reductase [Candidatus Brocadiaceae bacterium]|jgi:4-hydroxy-tetrahydrodipicolinate reductase